MPQDPNDPKVKAYYQKQRTDDLAKAASAGPGGDAARAELTKIRGKLKGPAQGAVPLSATSKGAGDAAKPVNVEDDPVSYLDPAMGMAFLGKAGMFGAKMAAKAAPAVGRAIAQRGASKLFPQVGEEIGGRAGALATRKALPAGKGSQLAAKSTLPAKRGELARIPQPARAVGPARVSNVAADALKGSKATGATKLAKPATRPALRPAKPLGKDFKAPKTGKAGTPRISETSARAKGTNPRQAKDYVRKGARAAAKKKDASKGDS